MKPEDILSHPPRVLSQAQRERYFATGYLAAEGLIPQAWLDRLSRCPTGFSTRAAPSPPRTRSSISAPSMARTGRTFAGCARWSTATPISGASPASRCWPTSPPTWSAPTSSSTAASSITNGRAAARSSKWHQDIPAWPHTNYSPVTLGVYLGDVPAEKGPLTCIPGSHNGPIFVHRDDNGAWTGSVRDGDMASVD